MFRKKGTGLSGCRKETHVLMKIVNVESKGFSPRAKAELSKLGELIEADADRDELLCLAEDADILIVRLRNNVDREVFERARQLKAIVTATTGLNHIDLNAARENGVTVLSLRGEIGFLQNVTATAELTWGLILCLVRRIPWAHDHVLSNGWDRDRFKGRELKDKAIGIIGFGRLGKIVAEYARAFRMTVWVCDPYVKRTSDWVRLSPLHEVLAAADIVSLHVPLNEETRNFFGAKEFSLMRPGAYFVNTSRGEVVDESALLQALRSGQLAGAALDVLANETSKSPKWLMQNEPKRYAQTHDNLILTPHIGGATHESMEETEIFIVKKLKEFLLTSSVFF